MDATSSVNKHIFNFIQSSSGHPPYSQCGQALKSCSFWKRHCEASRDFCNPFNLDCSVNVDHQRPVKVDPVLKSRHFRNKHSTWFLPFFIFLFSTSLRPVSEVQVRFELPAGLYLHLSDFKLSCGPLGVLEYQARISNILCSC